MKRFADPGPANSRPGYALLAVIAALTVAELLVLGLWRVAVGTVASVSESTTRVSARVQAEAGLRRAIIEWDELATGQHPAGSWYTVPMGPPAASGQSTIEAIHLLRGIRLLRSTASVVVSGQVRARATAEATLSAIPVDEFWRDFHSAIVAGGPVALAPGDSVDGTNAALPPGWSPADCPAPAPAPGARPGLALAAGITASFLGAVITGAPPILTAAPRTAPSDFARIGGVTGSDFEAIADRREAGSIALASGSAGTACDTARPGNWGEPARATHPCHDYFPIVFADSDTEIVSGEGQGILIVDGNLHLAAGVRFYGAILVRGSFEAAGAEIHGSLRIAGTGPASRLGGAFLYSECALDRAFRLAPGLRRLYRISDRSWLPAF